jgi:DNA-directed RNA polymerase specialized sigma24 family protein
VPSSTSSPRPSAESAIAAFLHGIERRAWVFAHAQCGEDALAEQAVRSAVATFRRDCAGKPLASWPRDFWTVLLAQPVLLQGRSQLLPGLTVGPRAALLLRLVAGLDMAHAAQVLGVSEAAYRAALNHALQQLHASNDPTNVEALRERLQQEIRQAPLHIPVAEPELAQTELEDRPAPWSAEPEPVGQPEPPWRLAAKITLGVFLLALALSFFWTPWHRLAPGESEPLPAEAVAALAPADASAAVTHPDFALLAAPADERLSHDLAFYSWLAAGGPANVTSDASSAPANASSTVLTAPANASSTTPSAPANASSTNSSEPAKPVTATKASR